MPLGVTLLESLGDPVVAVDVSGRVIVWAPAAERLLGHQAATVIGGALPDVGIRIDGLLSGRERRLSLRRRDGTTFPATVTATPLIGPDGHRDGVVLLIKDLTPWIGPEGDDTAGTEDQLTEERLGAAFRGIIEATGSDLDRSGKLEWLAQSLAEQGRRLLPGISCLITIVPVVRPDTIVCLAGAGPFAESLVPRTIPRATSVVGTALSENRTIERIDMQDAAAEPELFIAAGVNTMRVVPMSPLAEGGQAIGATVFFRAEPQPLTQAERRLLDDFGALTSLTLQRAVLQATAERSMARLQLAVDIALDLARSLDVAEVVRRLSRRAALATNADRCAVLRVEGGTEGELLTVDVWDSTAKDAQAAIGFRQSIMNQPRIREAVLTRRPVASGIARMDVFPESMRRSLQGIRHSAMIPLVYGGNVEAVLVLSRRRDQPFGQDEQATVMLLAGPAALALRNSYLYSQTEEASRVKTDFLDMAAHELRTPLTVISGYLSILREGAFGPAPEKWKNPLAILDAKAMELRRLVDDLLLAARLETGRLETANTPVDLCEIAAQVVEAASVTPEFLVPEDPVMVRGDREQLVRLVDHLVTNAFAYGREGAPSWARVTVEPVPDSGVVRLKVDDRGRGVPPREVDKIFDRFVRFEDPHQSTVPGTGLGLYIARELAHRHGGELVLERSQPGVGSRFTLTLPLLEGVTWVDPDDI